MGQLKGGTTINGYLALHTGNIGDYNVPGGSTGDIQYNNAGSFGGFGSVNSFDIQLDKPLLLENAASHGSATNEGCIAYDFTNRRPVYRNYYGAWMPFDNRVVQNLSGSTPTLDPSKGRDAFISMSLATNLSFTPNAIGDTGTILVRQDSTGGRTLTLTTTGYDQVVVGTITSIATGSFDYSTVTYKRFSGGYIFVYGRQSGSY